MTSAARPAPEIAARGRNCAPSAAEKNDRYKTAAALAPLVMPNRSGEASGLRMMLCRISPDTARAAPTRAAKASRGMRSCSTMNTRLASALPVKTLSRVVGDRLILPTASEIKATSSVSARPVSKRVNTVRLNCREKLR